MNLDTGAFSTLITNENMNELGVKYGKLPVNKADEDFLYSQPVNLSVGSENYTVRLPIYALPWVARWPLAENMYGVVGWPEVRNNILRFDGATHTVSALPELPADTANWVKLKIYKDNLLFLEIPLSENKIGMVLVDTGSPEGIHLAEPQFNEWEKAHPDSKPLIFDPYSPVANNFRDDLHDIIHDENYWANEVQLGGLTFTHIPLRKAWRMEAQMVDYYMGTLGMYALGQLELVVDNKNGWAYARTMKEPFKKGDWTVDGSVHLNIERLLLNAADYNRRIGDEDSAMADYSQLIKSNAQNWNAYAGRGITREVQGDFVNALADFEHAGQLQTEDQEYTQLFCQLLRLRLGQSSADFATNVHGWKKPWVKTIGQFILGGVDEPALLAAAEKRDIETVNGQRCEAFYYIGALRLLHHDLAGARDFFQKSVATGEREYFEYQFAQAELARLDAATKK